MCFESHFRDHLSDEYRLATLSLAPQFSAVPTLGPTIELLLELASTKGLEIHQLNKLRQHGIWQLWCHQTLKTQNAVDVCEC